MLRIAVIDDFQRAAAGFMPWANLADGAVEVTYFHDHLRDADALVERLAPFDALIVTRERTRFPRELLTRLPALRLLVSTGMGTAHIDVAATHELGIVVSGTAGGGRVPIEMTWALILELVRGTAAQDAAVRGGAWGTSVPMDLSGATLGLAGLGRLGRQVAAVGAAFGMDIVAWSQNLTPEAAAEGGARWVDKQTLMRESDVLSVHLVLSDRSRGLFGAADLALMKPTAYLVNTSRGPIIDEAALVDVLRGERIAGAGLDVFDIEPLPADHPLRSTPRTVLSPHVGYVSQLAYRAFYGQAVEDVAAFLSGTPVRVLNP